MPWPESKWMFSWYCPMGASAGAEMATSVDWGPLGTALALQASLLCGWLRLTRKMALSGPGPGEGGEGGTVESFPACTSTPEKDGQGIPLGLGSHSAWTHLSRCLCGPSLSSHLREAFASVEAGEGQGESPGTLKQRGAWRARFMLGEGPLCSTVGGQSARLAQLDGQHSVDWLCLLQIKGGGSNYTQGVVSGPPGGLCSPFLLGS